jgi:hypothetical protein
MLAHSIVNQSSNIIIICTINAEDLTQMTPCNHEEADTRIFVHVKALLLDGHSEITIFTVDTDVVVIAVSQYHVLERMGLKELWIEFGVGKNRKWLAVHSYALKLGQPVCEGLLFWYAFSGCDKVFNFAGRGKTTAWQIWKVYDEVTDVFRSFSSKSDDHFIDDNSVKVLERYVCILYSKTTELSDVNECRRMMFTKKGRTVDNIPPTNNALLQHIKRAVYQAG